MQMSVEDSTRGTQNCVRGTQDAVQRGSFRGTLRAMRQAGIDADAALAFMNACTSRRSSPRTRQKSRAAPSSTSAAGSVRCSSNWIAFRFPTESGAVAVSRRGGDHRVMAD